jgi:hypothetical protein
LFSGNPLITNSFFGHSLASGSERSRDRRRMNVHTQAGGEDPLVVTQFYYSQTFPYLMLKHQAEIRRRLVDVPASFGNVNWRRNSSRWVRPPAIPHGRSIGPIRSSLPLQVTAGTRSRSRDPIRQRDNVIANITHP